MTGLQTPAHEAQLRSTDHKGSHYVRAAWSRQDKGPGRIQAAPRERPTTGTLVHNSHEMLLERRLQQAVGRGH